MDSFRHSILNYISRTGFSRIDPEAALIDMDGTLYDSMPSHAHAWKLLTDGLGFNFSEDEFFLYEGMTGEATLRMFFERAGMNIPPKEEIKEMYRLKTYYFKRDGKADIMPGAKKMVAAFADASIKRVLVTGSGQRSIIDKVCTDFDGLFSTDAMITSHDVEKGKPDPEPYLKGMVIAGVKPWQSIVVENAPLGIISGNKSGAFTVAVCTGPIPKSKILEAGPDMTFDSMEDFASALPQLISELKRYNANK